MNDQRPKKYQRFGSTRYPVSGDSKLWRYMDFEKFVWLLENETLYHPRLDCLEDPYEGSVTRRYAEKRDADAPYAHDIDGAEIPFSWIATDEVFIKQWKYTGFVTCWHASEYESPAMWRMYSHEGRGVALTSTLERLTEAADVSPYVGAVLGPVEYFDFEKDDMSLPLGLMGMPGFCKRKEFEHEKEVRGMVRVLDYPRHVGDIRSDEYANELRKEMPKGVEVKVNLLNLISGIILSPLSEDWYFQLVQSLAKSHELGDLVQRSTLDDDNPVY